MQSKYFSDAELSCRCGCGERPQDEIMKLADLVRNGWNKPLLCSSGARCKKHNEKVGGAKYSAHMNGLAIDLQPINSADIVAFQEYCGRKVHEGAWLEGKVGMEYGRYTPTWVHLQLRQPYGLFIP